MPEYGPWTPARFRTSEDRDRFLSFVADLRTVEVEVESMPGEGLAALVRWRPGKFLGLNDAAYAHGGRIVVPSTRRRKG